MRRKNLRFFGWVVVGILGIGLASEAQAQTSFCWSQTDLAVQYLWPTMSQSVGAAVVTFKLGEEPCFFFSGEVELGSNIPPDRNTVFELASVTKVFTTAILGMHDGINDFSVYAPVKPYLPPGYDLTPQEQGVTFQQLATFTGGFWWSDPPDFTKGHAFSQDDFVADVNSLVPDADDPIPGVSNLPTNVRYSNGSVGLLGQILMQMDSTSGRQYTFDAKGFSSWISDNLTGPLNMPNTKVHPKGTVATGYKLKGGEYIVPVDSPFPWVPWGAAGALRSTTADMLTVLQANICAHHAADPACASFPVDVLSGLLASHFPNTYSPPGVLVDPTIYISGCESRAEQAWAWVFLAPPQPNPNNVKPIIEKDGGHPGFSTWIGFSPDKEYGLVILLNTGGIAVKSAGRNMIQHTP